MDKMYKLKAKIGILITCFCALCYLSFAPIIPAIAQAFPDTDIALIQMIITIPNFMFIIFSPVSGKLADYIRKKTMLMFGVSLYLVGGLFPFFFHTSIWELLFGSVVIGCGSALIMGMINAFICEVFEESERGSLMGLNATFVSMGGLVFTFLGGNIVRFGWRYCFLIFLLLVPILVVMQICLPSIPVVKQEKGEKKSSFEMNPYIACVFIIGIVYFGLQNAFNTNSALYVEILGIGGADKASLLTMGNTLGGMIFGLLFGTIVAKVDDQIETLVMAIAAAGFFIVFASHTFAPIIGGGFLIGCGFAGFNAGGTYLLSKNLSPEANAFTISCYLGAVNASAALSPVIVNNISKVVGDQVGDRFLTAGAGILIAVIVSLLVNMKKMKSAKG